MRGYLLAATVALGGCLDPGLSGTREAVVIAANDSGEYALRTRTVTADDFTTLEGESVRLVSRPELVINLETEEVTVEGDDAMHVGYAEDGGALVALDYLGLVALTTYHHMSDSHAYFRALGLGETAEDLPQQRVMFLPKLKVDGQIGTVPANDNMAFIPELGAFIVLAELQFDEIPLAANHGVVAHEFSHAVLHHMTDDANGSPPDVRFGWDAESSNFWRALHEGLADVHGAGLTDDPNFMAASVSGQFGDRSLTGDHTLTESLLFEVESSFSYDPYPMGSVLAATFWSYRAELMSLGMSAYEARSHMARTAFDTVSSLDLTAQGFHVADYLTEAATHATESAAWCAAVQQHFSIIMDRIGGCP